MIISNYIKEKFQSFGISVSEADLFDMFPVGSDAELTVDNKIEVETAMNGFIPQLLLRPKSISEGGYGITFDTQGIRDYYSFVCKKYNLEDLLSSSITDISDNW